MNEIYASVDVTGHPLFNCGEHSHSSWDNAMECVQFRSDPDAFCLLQKHRTIRLPDGSVANVLSD